MPRGTGEGDFIEPKELLLESVGNSSLLTSGFRGALLVPRFGCPLLIWASPKNGFLLAGPLFQVGKFRISCPEFAIVLSFFF